MSSTSLHEVFVHAVRDAAEEIKLYELQSRDGGLLPAFTPGAHIDLHFQGISRSYSLLSDPEDCSCYRVAVALNAQGRGGSRRIHSKLLTGSTLSISSPRNMFPLDESAEMSVFIAGGIGITPVWSMIKRLERLGKGWRLHYAARSRRKAALLADLVELGGRTRSGEVSLYFNDELDTGNLSVADVFNTCASNCHYYCCGPETMLSEFESCALQAAVQPEKVHLERFGAAKDATPAGAFQVKLVRSGLELTVGADQSILDVIRAGGVDAPFSCGQGVCGECETRVLEGVADHRDFVLSRQEQESNRTMMICCSRAKADRLVLDL